MGGGTRARARARARALALARPSMAGWLQSPCSRDWKVDRRKMKKQEFRKWRAACEHHWQAADRGVVSHQTVRAGYGTGHPASRRLPAQQLWAPTTM